AGPLGGRTVVRPADRGRDYDQRQRLGPPVSSSHGPGAAWQSAPHFPSAHVPGRRRDRRALRPVYRLDHAYGEGWLERRLLHLAVLLYRHAAAGGISVSNYRRGFQHLF